MLTPCWFQELASRAWISWIVQHPVIWVQSHLSRMVQLRYVCITVSCCAEICEDIWQWYDQRHEQLVVPGQKLPYDRYEQGNTGGDEAEEEYQDNWMLLVHEIVPQSRSTARDAAICEEDIEFTERRWDMVNEKAVKKANGRVSSRVSEDLERAES